MRRIQRILIFTLFLLLLSAAAWSGTWYVKPDGSDANSGQSWGQAKRSIHAAVSAASGGDEIWVKEGTYSVSSYIWVNKGVSILGGFAGTEGPSDQREWWKHKTTVDGQDSSLCFDVAANAIIDGFTITHCSGDYGGGMMIKRREKRRPSPQPSPTAPLSITPPPMEAEGSI